MTRLIHLAVFLAGLVAVGWVGVGYIGVNPLALAMTLLIGVFYVIGAVELWRFRAATATLDQALAELKDTPPDLPQWLGRLHPSLRTAVRLRVEGERASLPGPALTPYLAGLLVLLGMLGTFMGMVVTLQGTGVALDTAHDLAEIRNSLSAPVRGLGLAFGTSVAGVAASAMLGLLAALIRRERLLSTQHLDARIGSTLRGFSQSQQRDATLGLLQQQAAAMPALVEQVQVLMKTLAEQNKALHDRLDSRQAAFDAQTQAAYTGLAASVDQSLQKSLDHSARVAADALQPVVQATLASLAKESGELQQALTRSVREQLEGLASRFEGTSNAVAQSWQGALAEHQRSTETLSHALKTTHDQAAQQQAEHSATLAEQLFARLDAAVATNSSQWRDALTQQQQSGEALAARTQQALEGAAERFDSVARQFGAGASTLVDGVGQQLQDAMTRVAEQWQGALAQHSQSSEVLSQQTRAALEAAASRFDAVAQSFGARADTLFSGVDTRLLGAVGEVADQWQGAIAKHSEASSAMGLHAQQALDTAASRFDAVARSLEERTAGLMEGVSARLESAVAQGAEQWQGALAQHAQSSSAMGQHTQQALEAATARFDTVAQAMQERTRGLVDGVSSRLESAVAQVASQWQDALAQHTQASSAIGEQTQQALQAATARFDTAARAMQERTTGLVDGVSTRLESAVTEVAEQWKGALAEHAQASSAMGQHTQQALEATTTRFDSVAQAMEARATGLVESVGSRLDSAVAQVAEQWREALAQQAQTGSQWASDTQAALSAAAASVGEQGAALLATLQKTQAEGQSLAAEQDAQRLSAWTGSLEAMRDGLQQHWAQAGEHNLRLQQQICDTLAQTARDIATQTEAHASGTIAEIGQLVQAAAEAPRAAAEVVGELRQKLSDSMVRDNSMLEERTRILDTLSTLLDAVNHASNEQRGAIDALVSTSASLLERVGSRFGEQVESQAQHLSDAAAQVSASTAEVASLGEAFGGALQGFGQSSEKLVEQLERIEGALSQSMARSDEQLAYYVAQAREVIDLSLMSQKQIIEDLQQIASRQARASQAA